MTARPERSSRLRDAADAMAGAAAADLRAASIALAAAAVVAGMLGSGAIRAWANALPVGPTSDVALDIAERWDDTMRALRLTCVADAASSLLRALRSAR